MSGAAGPVDPDDPANVLAVVAEILRAAMTADRDHLPPVELVPGPAGLRVVWSDPHAPPDPSLAAPEGGHAGATPAGLVFAAGALGARIALGELALAPADPGSFSAWRTELLAALDRRWRSAEPVSVLAACLEADPFARPLPWRLAQDLERRTGVRAAVPVGLPDRSLTRTPPLPPSARRAEEGLRLLIGVILVGGLVLAAVSALGLAALYLVPPARSPAPAAVAPSPAPEPAIVIAPPPVPETPPAPPPPAPPPKPKAPVPEPAVGTDLIDPWK